MRTDILGVGFDDLTLEEAVARGTAFLEEDRFHYVVTPNPELMASMAAGGKRLYLLGAKPGVAEAAARNLEARYPGLSICGTHDGYFQEDGPVVEEIRRSGADAVFVCLGAPKQEYWMREHGLATGARLMAGLGGSLDVFAGVVERAPESWQKMGLEWLYRLMKEPSRIGRMARLPLFLASALGERCKRKGG